jgi:acetylornithine/N-succinyldiaminopimelate aminotransferase
MGLMLGLDTVKPVSDVVASCMEKGVLPLTAHGKVRLLPSLNISMDQLEKAVALIKEVCS